jgi:hypothetical protein
MANSDASKHRESIDRLSQQRTNSIAYRDFPIPPKAGFELRPAPGKGWGAFATRSIACGTPIFTEEPLFVFLKLLQNITGADVFMAIQQVPPSNKAILNTCISSVRDNASAPFTSMTKLLEDNSRHVKRSAGTGFFPLVSRLNHSCVPNCEVMDVEAGMPATDDAAVTCYAAKDIANGQELTMCYTSYLQCMAKIDRHRALRFICICKVCTADTLSQQLSDMRRTLMRGLYYLPHGQDISGQKLASGTALIFDPKLKKTAEEGNIKLGNTLVYNLLTTVLLDQEGLLNPFMMMGLGPMIMKVVGSFKNKRNAKLARLALEQRTRWAEFCVAPRLWERSDAGDDEFARLMREK